MALKVHVRFTVVNSINTGVMVCIHLPRSAVEGQGSLG